MKLRLALAVTLALAAPATAQAFELGIQDAQAPLEQRNEWGTNIGATWERIVVDTDQPGVAAKIRESHAAGRKVILTVGGNGTRTLRPNFKQAMRYIQTLPVAERYTIGNEPDLDGTNACTYRKEWMQARRTLGRRLLWGDLSPWYPLTFTARARACGPLPANLDVAIHPYQTTDPLAPPAPGNWWQGGIGNLKRDAAWLKHRAGVRVTWWITEFGYGQKTSNHEISDERAAVMWPRAIRRAQNLNARVLIIYTAQGPSWDTRPRDQAWAALRSATA